jgi:hypothetical protein
MNNFRRHRAVLDGPRSGAHPPQPGELPNYFIYPYVEVDGKKWENALNRFSFVDRGAGSMMGARQMSQHQLGSSYFCSPTNTDSPAHNRLRSFHRNTETANHAIVAPVNTTQAG